MKIICKIRQGEGGEVNSSEQSVSWMRWRADAVLDVKMWLLFQNDGFTGSNWRHHIIIDQDQDDTKVSLIDCPIFFVFSVSEVMVQHAQCSSQLMMNTKNSVLIQNYLTSNTSRTYLIISIWISCKWVDVLGRNDGYYSLTARVIYLCLHLVSWNNNNCNINLTVE